MKAFSQTFLTLSTLTTIRGLKSISVALCFGITICLTGIANAETVTYSWTGTIVSVEVDDGTGTYTGTQVGDTFSGTFTYDPDSGNVIELFTSDGDSIVEPSDVWVEYLPGSSSGTITDGTIQLIATELALNITTDYPINDPEDQVSISNLFGKEVALGTLLDEWDVSFGVGNFRIEIGYLSIVNMQDDLSFRPAPPWSPPGSPDDPDNQIAIFEIAEETPAGDIFFAYGIITIAEVQHLPVEYTFSTTGQLFNPDPLLTGLTSVSGSFIYENAAAPIGTSPTNETGYDAWSALSGSADGNSFSDPLSGVSVGNDTFQGFRDFFLLGSSSDRNLNGFTFAGMPLNHVFIFWIEGQEDIPDFLDDQSLPPVLPPTTSGRLALGFFDPAGVLHSAFFAVTVVAGQPVDTPKLNFRGQLAIIEADNGGAV